jgi:hypothetical protein
MAPQFKQNGAASQAASVNAQQAHAPNASAQVPQPNMDGNGAAFGAIGPISDSVRYFIYGHISPLPSQDQLVQSGDQRSDLTYKQSDGFNLDFAGIDSSDVLESFDFESFLHTDDNGGFGTTFDPMGFGRSFCKTLGMRGNKANWTA